MHEVSGRVPIKAWIDPTEIEDQALAQLKNTAEVPHVWPHLAVMPDVHFGLGATIGSVVPMRDAICPAAVGVDIGCGMAAIKTNLGEKDLPDDLSALRSDIEAAIPVGFSSHSEPVEGYWSASAFKNTPLKASERLGKARNQLGTLGGGNHFIELCLDQAKRVWMVLHSGSRGIGNQLAKIHIERAQSLPHNQDLPDRDLAVFVTGTPEMEMYRHDLAWAQRYAYANRQVMLDLYRQVMLKWFPHLRVKVEINCHHNYVVEEEHFGEKLLVTRKGAISAREGQPGIIPGSMGTKSYIVTGLGNPESFHSASHGAGRAMSRGKAKKSFSVADLERQTRGIECRKDADVLDEIPAAYKDIDEVMANQADLVRIDYELRQVLCVKG